MRKHCSNICKLRPCLATETTNSASMRAIVTTALQRQYSQTELIFWTTLAFTYFLTKTGFVADRLLISMITWKTQIHFYLWL